MPYRTRTDGQLRLTVGAPPPPARPVTPFVVQHVPGSDPKTEDSWWVLDFRKKGHLPPEKKTQAPKKYVGPPSSLCGTEHGPEYEWAPGGDLVCRRCRTPVQEITDR